MAQGQERRVCRRCRRSHTVLSGLLCLNNATRHKVNQSRYLHTWSLGATVVAHFDATLSMPEMVNRKNALLGANSKEIASLVVAASADTLPQRRLGENGFATFQKHFGARAVDDKMHERIATVLR